MLLDLDSLFDPDRPAGHPVPVLRGQTIERPPKPSMSPRDLSPDHHFEWDERAAILEFDRGLSRQDSEAAALEWVVRTYRLNE